MVVDELRQKYSLKILLRVSGLSKSTYSYYHSDKHIEAYKRRKDEDERLLSIIKPIFEYHKSRYGYRRGDQAPMIDVVMPLQWQLLN